ncbi:MAG TPA: hypothetical protein VFG68_20005 [Fimbriiglobus sp.]|nr:hypothetical protein [Fimbriiglobus sp.]
MSHAVRCPSCRNLSRVGADALGRLVACPHCGRPFPATPDGELSTPTTSLSPKGGGRGGPTVARRARPAVPAVAPPEDDSAALGLDGHAHHGPATGLVGLALLPLGIPLLWLVGPALTGIEPIFSFAAPVALAAGLCGLGFGVAYAHGWTLATRVKATIALVMVGYFTGGSLYFLKKEWAESIRRHVGPGDLKWKEFTPPHEPRAYRVNLPGKWAEAAGDGLMPGWGLRAYRTARDKGAQAALDVAYEVGHGTPSATVAGPELADEVWFTRAREAVCRGCGGEVAREREVGTQARPGREYVVALPDGATNRIVRVYRAGDRAFCLCVEGAFVTDDAKYVERFFGSFQIGPK